MSWFGDVFEVLFPLACAIMSCDDCFASETEVSHVANIIKNYGDLILLRLVVGIEQ
jgi:hypothetical protein